MGAGVGRAVVGALEEGAKTFVGDVGALDVRFDVGDVGDWEIVGTLSSAGVGDSETLTDVGARSAAAKHSAERSATTRFIPQ